MCKYIIIYKFILCNNILDFFIHFYSTIYKQIHILFLQYIKILVFFIITYIKSNI